MNINFKNTNFFFSQNSYEKASLHSAPTQRVCAISESHTELEPAAPLAITRIAIQHLVLHKFISEIQVLCGFGMITWCDGTTNIRFGLPLRLTLSQIIASRYYKILFSALKCIDSCNLIEHSKMKTKWKLNINFRSSHWLGNKPRYTKLKHLLPISFAFVLRQGSLSFTLARRHSSCTVDLQTCATMDAVDADVELSFLKTMKKSYLKSVVSFLTYVWVL